MKMEWKNRRTRLSSDKENHNSNWITSNKSPSTTKPLNPTNRIPFSESPPTSIQFPSLSDQLLLQILSRLPIHHRNSNCLVSKRWLHLHGTLVTSVRVLHWEFLVTGRLFSRFPNLTSVDLLTACFNAPHNSGIFCTNAAGMCFHVSSTVDGNKLLDVMHSDDIDAGLRILSAGCPNLQRLAVVNASEIGVLTVAEACPSLRELHLLMCNDRVLRGIAACRNLQVLKLTGVVVDGLRESSVTDVGLTILAQGCKGLSKLELEGCRGSYEGIKAIGQCCHELEELTLCNHRMEGGWLPALPYCRSLKSLRLVSCKRIDGSDEDDDDGNLAACPVIQKLHLEKCQLSDRRDLRALFLVCRKVSDFAISNCWGLNDDAFAASSVLRKVRSLSVEGCSTLTTHGLESAIVSWDELRSLKVKSCNGIKDCEVNPALSGVFYSLKDLQWQPETKSLLVANLEGSNMRKRGSKFFRKASDWKSSLPRA